MAKERTKEEYIFLARMAEQSERYDGKFYSYHIFSHRNG